MNAYHQEKKGRRDSAKKGSGPIFQAPFLESLLYEMAGINIPVLLSLLVKRVNPLKWRESTLALR